MREFLEAAARLYALLMGDGFWRRNRPGAAGLVYYTRIDGRDVCTGCTDRREAASWKAGKLRELAAADGRPREKSPRLDDVLELMIADRKRIGRAAPTLAIHRQKAANLLRLLGAETDVNTFTLGTVERYIDARLGERAGRGRTVSRHTVRKELNTLHLALRLARKRRACDLELDRIFPDFGADYKPRERVLDGAELLALMVALPIDRRPHVLGFAITGARSGELARAAWADVHADGLLLRGTKTDKATGKAPMTEALRALLDFLRPQASGPLIFPAWTHVNRDIARACKRAKLAHATPNDLRRSFATWLTEDGLSSNTVAALLRHTDATMVERVYGRQRPTALAAALAPVERAAASALALVVSDDNRVGPVGFEPTTNGLKGRAPSTPIMQAAQGGPGTQAPPPVFSPVTQVRHLLEVAVDGWWNAADVATLRALLHDALDLLDDLEGVAAVKRPAVA